MVSEFHEEGTVSITVSQAVAAYIWEHSTACDECGTYCYEGEMLKSFSSDIDGEATYLFCSKDCQSSYQHPTIILIGGGLNPTLILEEMAQRQEDMAKEV